MKITGLQIHPYRIPFRAAFASARASVAHRNGLLVALNGERGHVGWGEAAPLPGTGDEPLEAAFASLSALAAELQTAGPVDLASLQGRWPEPCLAAIAVEMAGLDLAARVAGVPLADSFGTRQRDRIPVNATVDLAGSIAATERLVATEGFRCLKIKVGTDVEAEYERVAAIRAAVGPEVALRLDANGCWSVERAIAALRRFRNLDIDYVEQPVIEIAALAAVRRAVDVRLAADESVTGVAAVEALAAAAAADIVIVKPSRLGLKRAALVAWAAQARGLAVVVTSVLETGVGIAAGLQLAATLPDPLLPCGLATAGLLAGDVVATLPQPCNGWLRLPRGPGLGITPEPSALARWRREQFQGSVDEGCNSSLRRHPAGKQK